MRFWKRKGEGSSSSAAWNRRIRTVAPLAAGIVLTVLAVSAARQRIASLEREIRERNEPVEIMVAAEPIPARGTLSGVNLAKKALPASGAGSRNIPAAEFERILGTRIRWEIEPGEPILWSDLEDPKAEGSLSRTIPAGRRAITVDADPRSSFSGLLRPGDRVDILHEREAGTGFRPLLYEIPVVAVDRLLRDPQETEERAEPSTLTLSVLPEESIRLAHAAHNGKLQYLLRNPGDHSRPKRSARPARRMQHVEILKGGVPEERIPVTGGEPS
ncbi:MAG: Flp pilus assembly protein CpaB [Deltaproteobacteria bacterium GWC2_65_14]|nr:MAG: Flp pilus assembly protein CpaB [Deltaproteobacteria bacterium GWC2_65_14]